MTSSNFLVKDLFISQEGFSSVIERSKESRYPGQNILWTDDFRQELPIRIGSSGVESAIPVTIPQQWKNTLLKYGDHPALSIKRNGKWVTINYKQYYEECIKFAKALLALNYPEFTVVNLIGFNMPEWNIAYLGCIFARCLPVGIYTTNSQSACEYIATHSGARLVVAENREVAAKYYGLLEQGVIDRIVLYNDEIGDKHKEKHVKWNDFLAIGKDVPAKKVQERMDSARPGNCCTLIYTSGTTGMPKGVMLSHDNFIWSCKASALIEPEINYPLRTVSYLPLSHAAGQFVDIFTAFTSGNHVYFADPSALQGTLIQTLQEVRPQGFFSVPRVWEKIYAKMMEMAKSNGGILAKIGAWAKSIGEEETIRQAQGLETSFQFNLAKKLVYSKVKQALGLDECKIFLFGSAPLDPAIRKYFFSLNIFLKNGYGMTECTAPQCLTNSRKLNLLQMGDYLEVGTEMPGTQMKIDKATKPEDEGEICMRGRNVCMGYFKNAEETSKIIDSEGYLHSGDLGRITKDGILFITGRVKELIITAGGQNIPPILIQSEIKFALPCLSNVMVVGDNRKYLSCLISLKQDPPQSGSLEKAAIDFLASKGLNIKTVHQARNNPAFNKIIEQGIKIANNKAISRAQHVQQFHLMSEDFSLQNGTLTPTLKLKRREAMKKYEAEIESMYSKAKL